jgi:hypothetical protein
VPNRFRAGRARPASPTEYVRQGITAISARVRPIFEVLWTAAAVEPEVGQLFAEFEQNRLTNMKIAANWIARRGPLKP